MIVQSSGLPVRVIKEALFVLIQHSLVTFDALPVYRLDMDAVLARLAFGRMIEWVGEELSQESAEFLLQVMAAGRLPAASATPQLSAGLMECGALERIETIVSESGEEAHDSSTSSAKRTKTTSSKTVVPFLRPRVKEFARFVLLQERLSHLVRLRLNESCGVLMSAILRHFSSTPFSALQLAAKLPKNLEFPLDTAGADASRFGPLQQYLQVLASHFEFLRFEGGAFRFDAAKATRHCRMKLLEAFVKARFNQPSLRLFRILLTKKLVEERQLAKLSMLPGKEVRERLYQMLRVGCVQLQEVPKSADHAPSRTIFLWCVPEASNHAYPASSAVFRTAASRHAQALINLRDLAHLERRRHAQLLAKVERSDGAGNLDLLGDGERKQLGALKKTLSVLQLKADEVLQDFYILSPKGKIE
jgi:hypothetical protein